MCSLRSIGVFLRAKSSSTRLCVLLVTNRLSPWHQIANTPDAQHLFGGRYGNLLVLVICLVDCNRPSTEAGSLCDHGYCKHTKDIAKM